MGIFKSKIEKAIKGYSFDDVLLVPSYSDVKLEEIDVSTRIANGLTLKIPIISSPMDTVTGRDMVLSLGKLGGLGVVPRNIDVEAVISIVREAVEKNVPVGVAVGPFDDERVEKAVSSGASIIVIDTAHGHSKNVIDATRRYSRHGVPVMAGNIVTSEAAEALIHAGASSLRVGVGPGHACVTREVTGVGYPQLSAIAEVSDIASEHGVSVIADGGIEKPGDIVKAIATGADAVMLGYLLAGSDESPTQKIIVNGECYKPYRGMGSKTSLSRGSTRYGSFKSVPEGAEGLVRCTGPVKKTIEYLVGSLKQGMGYVGARTIEELKTKSRFIIVSGGTYREGGPRGLIEAKGSWEQLSSM